MGGICSEIRAACAAVAAGARWVQIDEAALAALAEQLLELPLQPGEEDPARRRHGSADDTAAFVLTLDAVNFGSGWFPHLSKRAGRSGYFTIALSLEERFATDGPWSARELTTLTRADVTAVFGQDPENAEIAGLMELFTAAWNELGAFLRDGWDGRFTGPLEQAAGSAQALVEVLARMPMWRDVARWRDRPVPFYKRAQIAASDLALAFGGRGPGRFDDLAELTIFADNLVPHVLRCEGVLVYDADLAARIEQGTLLEAGSEEEVEIRACGVDAVERLVGRLRARGAATTAHTLDHVLWDRGQQPAYKARPRHRARSVFY
jgi:hypothetical protein